MSQEKYQSYKNTIIEAYRPDPNYKVSEWADRYRFLSNKASAEPGKWRTSRTPYLRDIMDRLSTTDSCEQVVFMKGSQVGGTEAGNNWIGYIIDHAPAPILFVQPTLEMAKRNTKQRLDPLIEESPRLMEKVVKSKSRASGNTLFQKEFQGGILVITGANSPSGLRSMPARYIFFDETDAYPGDCDGEGSPINLAKARARTFAKKKFFLVSTPTIQGMSAIEIAFEDSNKYYFHVPCPHCEYFQKLIFVQLKYDNKDANTTRYQCIECKESIYNWQKTPMLKAGKWVCEGEFDPENRSMGYHLSSLYSPVGWYSWSNIIKDWFEAQKTPEALRTFVNTVLGETWKEKSDVPDWSRLYERRSFYKRNLIPKRVVFLTCGVDVQKDRVELEIVGWCRNRVSYSIDYRVYIGNTDDLNDPVWTDLEKLLTETWQLERNKKIKMGIKRLAIDSGYNTQIVYSWCRKHDPNRVLAIKGQDNLAMVVGSPKLMDINMRGKTVKRGVRLWPVGSSVAKSELYGWLRQPQTVEGAQEPYGFCYFPEYDQEYFRMLTGEEYITKIVKGYKRGEWQKIRERNEALDCRVYARAAASVEGIDRFTEDTWANLENQVFEPTINGTTNITPKRKKRDREGWL